jgi:hypothetical protein
VEGGAVKKRVRDNFMWSWRRYRIKRFFRACAHAGGNFFRRLHGKRLLSVHFDPKCRVWLDGEERSGKCWRALVPKEQGVEGPGWLDVYVTDDDGEFVFDAGEEKIARARLCGLVRWEKEGTDRLREIKLRYAKAVGCEPLTDEEKRQAFWASQVDEAARRITALHELALIKGWETDSLIEQFMEWLSRAPLGFWYGMRMCKQRAQQDLPLPWEERE